MNRVVIQSLQMLFVLLDLASLNLICLLTRWEVPGTLAQDQTVRYFYYLLVSNGLWIATTSIGRLYARKFVANSRRFIRSTERLYLTWALLSLAYVYIIRPSTLHQDFSLHVVLLFSIGLLFNRLIYLLVRNQIEKSPHLRRKVLILGHTAFADNLAGILEREDFSVEVMGFVADGGPHYRPPGARPLYTGLDTAVALSQELRVEEIFSTLMPEQNSKVYGIIREAEKALIRLRLVPNFSHFINTPVHIHYLQNIPVLNPRKEPLENVYSRLIKRVFDIVVSLVAIVFVLSWLVPLLGLLIRLDSPGPLFFVQTRSGKNNRPFGCFKFRSMSVNADADKQQAQRNDSRLTRIGAFIRKTSLDEFPQFLNVLKGDMSVVGPRPHMLRHTTYFTEIQDHYMVRHLLKPGITGWAQVNGARGEITEPKHIQQRVEYDLWYLENWHFWLDVRVVLMTVANIFKGEKNAF